MPTPSQAHKSGLQAARDDFLARLHATDPTTPAPPLLQPQIATLTTLLQTTLTTPSTPVRSILLLGPPRSGKTQILTRAISNLTLPTPPTHLSLTGLLHQTPLSAWRALAHQLHPTQPPSTQTPACIAQINRAILHHRNSSIPLLLTLDHFDRLVTTDPLSQNVLYTLLNLFQDPSLLSAIVALSPVPDITDLLEKRVKSRFAPRQLVVPLPATPAHILPFLHQVAPPHPTKPSDRKPPPSPTPTTDFDIAVAHFDTIAAHIVRAPPLKPLIARHLARTRVATPILHAVHLALSAAFAHELFSPSSTCLHPDQAPVSESATPTDEERVQIGLDAARDALTPVDELAEAASVLAVVELALLAALARVQRRVGKRVIVFGEVWREYAALGEGAGFAGEGGVPVMGRDVGRKAWERLVEIGLVVRIGLGPRHMRAVRLGVGTEVVERAVREHQGFGTVLKRWAVASVR